MKTTLLIVSFAVGAAAGCGTDVNATASGVFPAQGFTGRTVRVEISGDQTNWKDGATVTLGDGITVNSVSVASPTDLFADITIDSAATTGMHDVSVSSGGTFTLKQAFEVDAPISFKVNGTAAQGGLPAFTITNHDVENPFDTTSTGDGLFTPITYTNLMISGPSGARFSMANVNPFSISGFIFIDADAGAGGPVSVVSGPADGTQVTSIPADSFTITARAATALGASGADSNIANTYDSQLFSLDAASIPSLLRSAVSSTNANAAPLAVVLGPSGHWDDLITYGTAVQTVAQTTGSYYLVVLDGGGMSTSYPFHISGTSTAFTTAAEGTQGQHTTFATALAGGTLPFAMTSAMISSASDSDWIKFTTGTTGKKVHVLTYGGATTDVAVEVFDGTTCNNSLTGGPVDSDYQEDVTSDALTATTFCVQLTAGSFWDASSQNYTAAIWLE